MSFESSSVALIACDGLTIICNVSFLFSASPQLTRSSGTTSPASPCTRTRRRARATAASTAARKKKRKRKRQIEEVRTMGRRPGSAPPHHHSETISGKLEMHMNVLFKIVSKKQKEKKGSDIIRGAESTTTTLALTHSSRA